MASASVKNRFKFGNGYAVIVDVQMDDSYPTNGEAVVESQLGLESIDFVLLSPNAGYVPEFDHANKKVKVFYADCDYAGDKALIEVANGTNLSAIKFRGLVVGR